MAVVMARQMVAQRDTYSVGRRVMMSAATMVDLKVRLKADLLVASKVASKVAQTVVWRVDLRAG